MSDLNLERRNDAAMRVCEGRTPPDEDMSQADEDRMHYISGLNTQFSDLPDASYYAAMEEYGIGVQELESWGEWSRRNRR